MEGASASLDRIVGVQMELALIPLYEGEALLEEMIKFMAERDYVLMSIEPGATIRSRGQTIEIDGIFFRQKDLSGNRFMR